MLLTGPDLEYQVAVSADIREMYHQVRVNEEDQQSKRFLWRWNNTQHEPDEYAMMRMTFGTRTFNASWSLTAPVAALHTVAPVCTDR
uniref:Uncharacterized protein n=1 Tax=Anopheles dirus TaxID=7168 RepID=A0A182N8E1_9DIPT